MTKRKHIAGILPLLPISLAACVIEPGVLEGEGEGASADEVGEAETETETGTSELADCVSHGTNPAGGSDPGEFPVESCPIVCDEGWGHEPEQLAFAWTQTFAHETPGQFYIPIGMLAREAGVLIASRHGELGTELLWVDDAGAIAAEQLVEGAPGVLTAMSGNDARIHLGYAESDELALAALDASGNLLWTRQLAEDVSHISLATRPDGGVVATTSDLITGSVHALDAEGELEWSIDLSNPRSVALAPSGRIAVGGDSLTYLSPDAQTAQKLEFANHPFLGWSLHFASEDRLLGVGFDQSIDATMYVHEAGNELPTTLHTYNRGFASCRGAETWEWFATALVLADGSLLIGGLEQGPNLDGEANNQPIVMHLDAQGLFLASDRGLWFGQANALAQDASGAAYAALTIGSYSNVTAPISGFHLRKYLP
jgi:hypothetical protein